ncbi:glycosyltransferase family 4 protein [Pontibacter qinzhouensis]|uniref:Glycosyltransferase family 4 protein n=1 Tax=Pontibacter qinzhouensis TaxID=2603253 RepID=A0A5C8K4V7_9BACT|nr:glycosyltransferase family 1 protein [Pontibacter qinzhouensis]TXK44901.1 glycosyltransferase family 4 protein [Pontibacter qinzhouensis]
MKILYDHQVFANQRFGGISRYFYELMSYAVAQKIDFDISLILSNNVYAKCLKPQVSPFFNSFNFRGQKRLMSIINSFKTNSSLKKQQFDLFHPTFYNDSFLKNGINNKPFVVTCHDMIDEKFSHYFKSDLVARQKKNQLEAAEAILAVSENTKQDIIKILNIPENKIFVTPLASSFSANMVLPENDFVTKLGDFILYVGLRDHYKNFLPYVTAIAPILKRNSLKLISAGGGGFTKNEISIFKKLGIQDLVIQLPINDLFLAQLYNQALFFVFPSQYEGFGIPTLEAFSFGTPVLLANAGSLPEVGGNAALYFDPYDMSSMYNKTERLVANSALRIDLSNKGRSRSNLYSWEKAAKLTFKVYESVLS